MRVRDSVLTWSLSLGAVGGLGFSFHSVCVCEWVFSGCGFSFHSVCVCESESSVVAVLVSTVCVCVWERERDFSGCGFSFHCVCVCVCIGILESSVVVVPSRLKCTHWMKGRRSGKESSHYHQLISANLYLESHGPLLENMCSGSSRVENLQHFKTIMKTDSCVKNLLFMLVHDI